MRHYYAVAERGNGRSWWLSFPGLPGVFSAADDAGLIVAQATDALDTAVESGLPLPLSIEAGAKPPADLSGFEQPTIVVVIPFEHTTEAKVAA
jgi:predicted RNase H-like HicB family nuclease